MGLTETILFGFSAIFFAVLSIYFLRKNMYIASTLFGVCNAISVFFSGYNWRLALIDSGKNPAGLGFQRYPFAPITLAVLLIIAVFTITESGLRIIDRFKRK